MHVLWQEGLFQNRTPGLRCQSNGPPQRIARHKAGACTQPGELGLDPGEQCHLQLVDEALARFLGPVFTGVLYDLAQAKGAFYGGAVLTFIAFAFALWMRRLPLTVEAGA